MRLLTSGIAAAVLFTASAPAQATTVQEIFDAAQCKQTELLDGAKSEDEADSYVLNYRGPFTKEAIKLCIARKDEEGRFAVYAVDYVKNGQVPIMVRYASNTAALHVGETAQPENYNGENAKPIAVCVRASEGVECTGQPKIGSPFRLTSRYYYNEKSNEYRVRFDPARAFGIYEEFAVVAENTRPRVATQEGAVQLFGARRPEYTSATFMSMPQATIQLIQYAQKNPANTPIEFQIQAVLKGQEEPVGRALKSTTGDLLFLFNGMEKMAKRIAIIGI